MDFDVIKSLLNEKPVGKIVLLVMDGLGGIPMEEGGKTALEAAETPNMDALAKKHAGVTSNHFELGLHRAVGQHI